MDSPTQLPEMSDLIVAKKIVHTDAADRPCEIIYELKNELGFANGNCSLAVADILQSSPHYHQITTESYLVLQGAGLRLHVDGVLHDLKPGDSLTVPPLTHHWAEGLDEQWARVLVSSSPPWHPGDHHYC